MIDLASPPGLACGRPSLAATAYNTRHCGLFEIDQFDKRTYPLSREPKINSTQGNHYALDNICHTAGALAGWFGQFLHHGRIHSHSARARGRNPDHQPSQRTPRALSQ